MKVLRKILSAGLLALLIACQNPLTTTPASTKSKQNELSQNTHVLSSTESSEISSVSSNEIVFSGNVSYTPREILISGISANAPNGLIRKVNSVSGNVVYTSQATLEEAVKNASFSATAPVSSNIVSAAARTASNPTLYTSFNNFVLYDSDGNLATTSDQIVTSGYVSLMANLNLKFNIKDSKMDYLHFEAVGTDNANLTLSSGVQNSNLSVKDKIFEIDNIKPFILGYIPTTPPVPVVVKPIVDFYVGIDGSVSTFSGASITQNASIQEGAEFQNGTWNPIQSFTNSFSYQNADFTINSAKAYAEGVINFLFYGVAGPYAGPQAYLRMESNSASTNIYAGLDAIVGANVQVLGNNLVNYSTEIPLQEKLVYSYQNPSPSPSVSGKILFDSPNNTTSHIYSVNPDGTSLTDLSSKNNSTYSWNVYPSASRDGSEIVFSQGGGISIMNSDGTNLRQILPVGSSAYYEPTFSPDGTEIAYVSTGSSHSDQIWIMNSDGTNQRELIGPSGYNCDYPSWSPSGSEIAFQSNMNGNSEVYTINPNGTNLKDLTNNPAEDYNPSWSPNGSKIAFSSDRASPGTLEIYIMNSDGTNQTSLGVAGGGPSWSPNGTQLVYGKNWNLYVMNSDGSGSAEIPKSIDAGNFYWAP